MTSDAHSDWPTIAARFAAEVATEIEPWSTKTAKIDPQAPIKSSVAQDFPAELLLVVLRYLARVPVKGLWAARGACTHWREVASASPELWSQLAVSVWGPTAATVSTLEEYLVFGVNHRHQGHRTTAARELIYLTAVRRTLCPFSTSGWELGRRFLVARGLYERSGWDRCKPPSFGGTFRACKDGVCGGLRADWPDGSVPAWATRIHLISHARALGNSDREPHDDDDDDDDDDDGKASLHDELHYWLKREPPQDLLQPPSPQG